ncbi:MAG: hypothetical protein ACRCVT_11735 [Leadbetterella sp.]
MMIKLKAGNIDLSYQDGFLRQFKIGSTEVLRMINFSLRDANWGNYIPSIKNEKINAQADSFDITFSADYEWEGDLIFTWQVVILGTSASEITFEICGKATQTFKTNRAGFCVLHPLENLVGENVHITHADQSVSTSVFPFEIAPYQPFFDVSSLKMNILGNSIQLKFEGDVFETEDQRNWGDASYKTYCTPLSLPFPKTLEKGEEIYQKVTFSLLENSTLLIPKPVSRSQKSQELMLGIANSSFKLNLDKVWTSKIRNLNLSHYSVEIYLYEDWRPNFIQRGFEASVLKLPLELSIFLPEKSNEQIIDFFNFLERNKLNVKYLNIFSEDELLTNPSLFTYINEFRKHLPEAKIGVGTSYNFTELNRNKYTDIEEADYICLSFDPQEHAFDDLSIMENTESVKYMVESLRVMYNKPVHFCPITLKRRYNPYATDSLEVVIPIQNRIDPRQKTDFLADWTSKMIQELCYAGVESATFYETVGDLGIMDLDGNTYPVYDRLKV